jgi:hypothetical protein
VFSDRAFNNVLFINENKCEDIIYTNTDGFVIYHNKHNTHDIISEWVEPVEHELEVYFIREKKSKYICASTLDHQGYDEWEKLAKIKVKFTEGEGL